MMARTATIKPDIASLEGAVGLRVSGVTFS